MRDQDSTLLDVRDAGVRAFSLAGFYPFQRCLALVTEQTLTPPAAFRGGLLVCARAGNDRRRWWEICGRGWHAFAGKGDRFTNSGSAPPDVLIACSHCQFFGRRGRVVLDRHSIDGLALILRPLVMPLSLGLRGCIALEWRLLTVALPVAAAAAAATPAAVVVCTNSRRLIFFMTISLG